MILSRLLTRAPILICLCLISNSLYASTITLDGTIPGYVIYDKPIFHKSKRITFQKYLLSQEAIDWLNQNLGKPYVTPISSLSPQGSVGMNGVPVLDQGAHGTCVTFSATAALDAMVSHIDYISQLCSLSLGKYLHKENENYPSGWDGTVAKTVLWQIKKYGAISKINQKKFKCAGVKKYPKSDSGNTGKAMSPSEYATHSEDIMKSIVYLSILNIDDAISNRMNGALVLNNIKKAIDLGHRVMIGFLLDDNVGHNGAFGSYHAKNDSWVINKKIADDMTKRRFSAGHEVVITGYDDNGVIIDNDNKYHRGVVTLRNSWGVKAGDKGDYYMSYEYLSKLLIEATELMPY